MTPTGPPRSGLTLLVIAKQPVPGRVKTRLLPALTPEQAVAENAAPLVAFKRGRRTVTRPRAELHRPATETTPIPAKGSVP